MTRCTIGRGPLTAEIDLQRGAKIASLRDDSGAEWLLPPGPPAVAGTPFVAAEMGGWDECVPTIVATPGPGQRALPDHGDAWDVAWDGDVRRHRVRGRSMDYRLTRSVLEIAAGLRLEYEVEVGSPTPVLWAAHPQFLAPAGTRVLVDADEVVDVLGDQSRCRWGERTNSIDAVPHGGCRKFYVEPERTVGMAVLDVPGRVYQLRLTWDERVAPYLGLWFDHCAFAHEPVIALEPSTGYFDSLATAVANGRILHVQPDAPASWWVEVTVT